MAPETQRAAAFIARWQGREGGQEHANYALFLTEFCDTLNVPRPDPASASTKTRAALIGQRRTSSSATRPLSAAKTSAPASAPNMRRPYGPRIRISTSQPTS